MKKDWHLQDEVDRILSNPSVLDFMKEDGTPLTEEERRGFLYGLEWIREKL
jgi:hypothetical protein